MLRRFWPLLPLLALLAGASALGLREELDWGRLAARQAGLQALIETHPIAMAAGFVALYAGCVAVSFPVAVVLTVASGLLFGPGLGTALTVTGSTTGSVVIFLAARGALAPMLARQVGTRLDGFRRGLARNAFSYILACRLIPVIPFWLVNLAPALLGARLAPFALATFIGIIPASAVYASLGAGVGTILAAGGQPDLAIIFTPPILLPLLGLAALALLPAIWKARTRGA